MMNERDQEKGLYSWCRKETLGEGGFGFVSKADTHRENKKNDNGLHENLPPIVAVKSTTAKPEKKKCLSEEKKLLDKFRGCPFIVRCFGDDETFEDGERLYNIILEYASGGCLADYIQPHIGMPEQLVRRYTKSLLTALSHVHKLGYVHCDVKPHNVLLVEEDYDCSTSTRINPRSCGFVAKLADFGSAVSCSGCVGGEFHGTVLYAAPESIARQEYMPESDVWAVGCSVLNMLTGESPWKIDREKDKAEDVLRKIGFGPDIPEIPRDGRISKKARDFLRKCLIKNPRARCSADELLRHPFIVHDDVKTKSVHFPINLRLKSLVPRSCFHVRKSAAICSY